MIILLGLLQGALRGKRVSQALKGNESGGEFWKFSTLVVTMQNRQLHHEHIIILFFILAMTKKSGNFSQILHLLSEFFLICFFREFIQILNFFLKFFLKFCNFSGSFFFL